MALEVEKRDAITNAIRSGDISALSALDVSAFRDEFGAGAAHYAARHGQLSTLQHLRDTSRFTSASDARTTDGHTPLHDAAAVGHVQVARWLCDEKLCSPKDADASGCTPLHFAARFGQLEVVKLFVTQYGCDVMTTTKSGLTPLHWAACKGRISVVKWIVKLQQRSGYERAEDGTTPVYLAAQSGRVNCLQHIVTECHGSSRIRANDGTLPIHAAAGRGHYPVVKLLIQSDLATALDHDSDNASPMHYAAANGHVELLWWLVNNHRAIPDADRLGSTPLHDAAHHGQDECLSVLANAARLMENEMSHLVAEDASGQNPLDIAEREGHSGCVDVLSMRGVQRKAKRAPVQRHKNKGHRHQQGDAADNGGRKSPKLRKNRSGGNVPAPPPPPPEGDPSSPLSSIFSGVKLRKRDPTASVSSAASIGSGTNVLSQVHLRKVTDDATSEKSISSQDAGLLSDIRSMDKSQLKQANPVKRFIAPETGRVIDEEDDDDDGAELVVPSVDAEGKPIPEWKKKVLEKKVEHKKQKRAVKQQKDSEENTKWEGIPAWKRKVMEEREAKRLAELQPELARKRMEQERAEKVAAMPSWKRDLIAKK